MILRALIVATAVLALTAGAGWWRVLALEERLDAAQVDLLTARWEAAQARLASEVADAYRERAEARASDLNAAVEAILTGDYDGADQMLDPRLRALLRGLRDADGDRHP